MLGKHHTCKCGARHEGVGQSMMPIAAQTLPLLSVPLVTLTYSPSLPVQEDCTPEPQPIHPLLCCEILQPVLKGCQSWGKA